MNPDVNETQPNNPQDNIDLTNDELAAAMGFMTTLGDQQMMAEQEAMEGQETQETPQGEEQTPETTEDTGSQIEELKTEIMDELASIREEIKKDKGGDEEIENLKKEIEEVLNSE